jgi:hypothetical protein
MPRQYNLVHTLSAAVETTAAIPVVLSEDIVLESAKLFVNGVETPTAFAFSLAEQKIVVTNLSDQPWPAGTSLEVTWDGTTLHDQVADHETRIAALEAALTRR